MPLAFESVGYSYDSPKERKRGRDDGSGARAWALRDVTFTLADGEFIGLAGHTGSGKSTLIQHANGLLHPTVGRVLFDGGDLADKRVAQACRSAVGLVFQYPEHQLFAATVREDVAFGPRNLGLSDEEVAERVGEALRLVHLDEEDIGERSPFELSGGQQRRVAFAGVLAMRPRVLVMDEPVAGLDPVARAEFLELIGELHRSGLSIIMASHSMEDLARLADRMEALAAERGAGFLLRDAGNMRQSGAVVVVGAQRQPRGLGGLCGCCGFADCKSCTDAGGTCVYAPMDLGIALGSATAMAADRRIDTRVFFSAGRAAMDLRVLPETYGCCIAIGLSVSAKSPYFDR